VISLPRLAEGRRFRAGKARAANLRLCAFALSALCSGCAVGPDFEPPAPPPLERYTPEETVSPGNGQSFVPGDEVLAQWWTVFGSDRLDGLIDEAIRHSPTLEAAREAIRIADYNTHAAAGAFFPQLQLGSNSSYNYASGDSTTNTVTQSTYSSFALSATVNYTLDIWGANWRRVEGANALREVQVYQLQAAHTLLASRIAMGAIEEASLRAQIAATKKSIALEEQRLALLERQLAYGKIPGAEVLSERAALAQTQQTLPALENSLKQQRTLLTALAGRYASEGIEETFELSELTLPRDLPISLPSHLVEQRPDVKAATASLHSASAQIGVAVAARLPQITLTAGGGTTAFELAQLFHPGTFAYSFAGNIAQTAFDGMTLYSNQKAAEASYRQIEAQYRDTAIKAFQEVADALHALQSDARAVGASRTAEAMTRKYLDTVRARHAFGDASQLAVVDAQRSYLAAAVARIQAEAKRLSDTVTLFVALGGGWGKGEWKRG